MKRKKYKLKLSSKVKNFVHDLCDKNGVFLIMGSRKDFEAKELPLMCGGWTFEGTDGNWYIQINNVFPYGGNHDLVILHELAHFLCRKYDLEDQDESAANGFAFAMADILGVKINKKLVKEMLRYGKKI